MRQRLVWVVATGLLSFSFGAVPADAQRAKRGPTPEPAATQTIEIPAGQTVSPMETARFLAGLPPAPGSALAPLALEPWVQAHARYFDSEWAGLEARQLAKVRAFAAKNLTNPQKTLFYTFSGPDFLYADAFFPKAQTYILVGLEPVGPIPDVTKIAKARLPEDRKSVV